MHHVWHRWHATLSDVDGWAAPTADPSPDDDDGRRSVFDLDPHLHRNAFCALGGGAVYYLTLEARSRRTYVT